MNNKTLDQFIADAVVYPCCGFDGAPVQHIRILSNFIYIDYTISPARFVDEATHRGFRGYALASALDLLPETVLGESWDDLICRYRNYLEELPLDWSKRDFGIKFLTFERLPDFTEQHGPETFKMMFVCFEAIATLRSIFNRRSLAPKLLCAIRPGVAFGGNYNDFTKHLEVAIRENPAGLPDFLLYDRRAATKSWGDYQPLTREYNALISWNHLNEGYGRSLLTLAEHRCLIPRAEQGPSGGTPLGHRSVFSGRGGPLFPDADVIV